MSKVLSALTRVLQNIIRVETIVSHKSNEGKSLATIDIDGNESEYFPVWQLASSFKKHWVPITSGEQVIVFFPFGNTSKGYLFRSGFSTACSEPTGSNATTEVITYSDGTRVSFDVANSTLSVDCKGSITIKCTTDVTINADSCNINSDLNINGSITCENIAASGVITDSDGNNGA